MKNVATIATVIAAVLFLLTTMMLSGDSVGRSTKDGMLLFNFLIWFSIPGVLWLIYYLKSNKS